MEKQSLPHHFGSNSVPFASIFPRFCFYGGFHRRKFRLLFYNIIFLYKKQALFHFFFKKLLSKFRKKIRKIRRASNETQTIYLSFRQRREMIPFPFCIPGYPHQAKRAENCPALFGSSPSKGVSFGFFLRNRQFPRPCRRTRRPTPLRPFHGSPNRRGHPWGYCFY